MRRSQMFLWGFVLISTSVNIGLIYYAWPYLRPSATKTETPGQKTIRPLLVQVAVAKKEAFAQKKKFLGTLKAAHVVPIVSEIQGRVTKIAFHQGDYVKKGQLLIQLDDMQPMAQLKEAEAQVKVAQANYGRQKTLFDKGYASQALLDKAEAEKDSALAMRGKAMVQLKLTRILAPFDGEIGLSNLTVGSQVNNNQEITRLVGRDSMIVEFQVAESEVRYIYPDQEVDVVAEGCDTLPIQAKIKAIEPYSDPVAHTVRVKAIFSNPDNKFRDGAFANVTLALATDDQAIVIPKESVSNEGDSAHVFVIKDNTARKKDVILGMEEGDFVQITNGIEEGEVVAVDPVEMLVDGSPVSIDTSH